MKKEQLHTKYQVGFSLVEVILASAIFVLFATTLVGGFLYGEESTMLAGNRARATLLAEEGVEAVRNIRDPAFTNLVDGTYGLTTTSNQWNLFGSSDVTGIFTRQVVISTLDPKRKSATVHVSWQQNSQRSAVVTLVTRLTNWIAAGIGNWAIPLQGANINFAGNNDGLKIASSGNYAFLIRNASTPDFVVVDISNPAAPAQVGSLTLAGTLADIAIAGNYAYVTSNDNNAELLIVDISNPISPSLAGTFNAAGSTDAKGVFVSGTTVYLGRLDSGGTDEFLVVNASNPASPTLQGTLNISGNMNQIVVLGNYAYVASSNNSQELQVVNITNPALPTLAGSFNLASNTDAITIDGFGSTVVIGQGTTLYTLNVTTPASPSALGSINTSGTVNDIDIGNANTYVFVAGSLTTAEFRVINITAPSSPTILGSVNVSGTTPLLGLAYDSINDKVYAVSSSDTQEFLIFSPQ